MNLPTPPAFFFGQLTGRARESSSSMKPVLLTDKTHSLVKKSAVAQGVNMSALADDILAKGLAPKKPAKKAKP